MDPKIDLEKELVYLGLLDKAREIYLDLDERAALSYIKSSYRLLSKVYHPDLNPGKLDRAKMTQQRLNRVSRLIDQMQDKQIIELIVRGANKDEKPKKKILVVEDEFGLQEVFRDVLMMEGYDVRVAVDGDSGYDLYCQFEPDLVFTDVIMPRMNGIEMVKKIRSLNPKIKVIFVSGFFGIKELKRELNEELLNHGYRTLSKPFKISGMLDLVNEYLSAARTVNFVKGI